MTMAIKAQPLPVLTEEQLHQFHAKGYLVLESFAPAALCEELQHITQEHLAAAIEPLEYEADVGYPGAPDSLEAPGGRTVRRLRGAYQRHPSLRGWAKYRPLVAVLRQLLQEPPCLTQAHHNCVMTKHPDYGTATDWHRDIRYWSFLKPDLISVWLSLGAENAQNGGLKFIPGSHRMAISPDQLDDLDFLRPDVEENQELFAQGVELTLAAGDVVLFHSGLFHAAGANQSDQVKTSVVFAYHGHSNRPIPGTRSAHSSTVFLAN
ncbi:phytanoyl-CoA dioxygenase family protein [Salinispirillum sp. LH 10-3-1]|uniref:Phytanoyl-CoA dioxygenase family protein n=1 Tax=Salinispirillum sp. LH 10-3-1 TaxID=2952525 RepID=A0AB38YF24_9GAMM